MSNTFRELAEKAEHFSEIDPSVEMASWISPSVAVELITRLRQAEKDAARYRWLRDELEQSQGGIALFDGDCHVCDIDLFIDEAMQCK